MFGFGILASGTRDGRSIGRCVAATWKRRFGHTFPTEASKGGPGPALLLRKAVAFNCSGAGPLAEFELATGVKLTEASERGV